MSAIARQFMQLRPYGGAGLIMADPPWRYDTWSENGLAKSPQAHYQCEGIEWIKSLPVADLAGPNCMLWLWATNPMLPEAIDVLTSWGFRYSTAGTWIKRTKNGKLNFGGGYILRSSNEPFLIGLKGKLLRPKEVKRNVRTVIEAPIREHSRKPDEAYTAAKQLVPHAAAIDLFARESRPGWKAWGNETGKFDDAA